MALCAVEPHPMSVRQHGNHHKDQPHPAEKQHDASVKEENPGAPGDIHNR